MTAARFALVTHWRIDAPVERVWAALSDPAAWPRWWPCVRRVHTLREGDADGIGARRRFEWSTRLPYTIEIEVEAVESVRHQRLRGRASGQLEGEGVWTLRAAGGATAVTYLWQVEVAKPWMRRLAPVLAPVFRWNHDGVMTAGEAGLRRYLGGEGDAQR